MYTYIYSESVVVSWIGTSEDPFDDVDEVCEFRALVSELPVLQKNMSLVTTTYLCVMIQVMTGMSAFYLQFLKNRLRRKTKKMSCMILNHRSKHTLYQDTSTCIPAIEDVHSNELAMKLGITDKPYCQSSFLVLDVLYRQGLMISCNCSCN